MDYLNFSKLLLNIVTAIGVVIAAVQLWLTKRQAVTAFEDQVSNEYRQIARSIPVKALLCENLTDQEFDKALNELYNYIDFSNEQVFLRQQRRIRKSTWQNWCEGIESNLKLPAFNKAWKLVKEKLPDSFNELRTLEAKGFSKVDPRKFTQNR